MKTSDIEVEYKQHCGNDLAVANAARVSFHKESQWEIVPGTERFQKNSHKLADRDAKLIHYLAKHKHTSPFNHSYITLRVKAPIFVARQLVKHKFMPWNEVSRRYVDDEPEFYFPKYWRAKAENVKQGSSDDVVNVAQYHYEYPVEIALQHYKGLLEDAGVAPEQARMVLPQNTMTEWWWSGTLGAWADMLRLRLDPHAQYESRLVAMKARDIIQPLFPVSLPALLND